MYCVKCGVELADSEAYCPLCGTVSYHPEIKREVKEKLYPTKTVKMPDTINIKGILFIISVAFFIAASILVLCDIKFSFSTHWSGYAVGGLILLYTSVILPAWFKKPNPVIFVPVNFGTAILFLFYINFGVGGNWFLSFAFPITGALGLIITAAVTLFKYLKKGYLYVSGGLVIALAFYICLIEFLIRITFNTGKGLPWSIYPFTALFLIGITLIVIAICRPLRIYFHKKFFI